MLLLWGGVGLGGGDSLVTATCLLALPSSMTSMTSSGLDTKRSVQPWQEAHAVGWSSRKWAGPGLRTYLHEGNPVLVFVDGEVCL